MPTRITSRSSVVPAPVFYGIEKQPYISEIYWDNGNDQLAIELTNPHNVQIDLAPAAAGGASAPYSLRLNNASGALLLDQPFGPDGFSANGQNLIAAGGQRYVANNDYENLPVGGRSADSLVNVPAGLIGVQAIQLVRILPDAIVVCDQVAIPDWFKVGIHNRQRDNKLTNVGGWRVTVPLPDTQPDQGLDPTLGTMNSMVTTPQNVAPVHATTDDMGLESAYPTTGSMLLLMRYANTVNAPATKQFKANFAVLDNGHMPVFDQTQLAQANWNGTQWAQPMDGTTQLSIPWGQLVFDYFTALPFENQYDPNADPPGIVSPVHPGNVPETGPDATDGIDNDLDGLTDGRDQATHAEYVAYLRANQPAVELGGVRVHGRININAAPWKVLQGAPLMPPGVLPIYKHFDPTLRFYFGSLANWSDWTVGGIGLRAPDGNYPMGERSYTLDSSGIDYYEQLGSEKAKGIVAYRELREITDSFTAPTWSTGSYNVLPFGGVGTRWRQDTSGPLGGGGPNFLADVTQRHTAGFLTVGELANVSNPNAFDNDPTIPPGAYQMDNGQAPFNAKNYLFAVAPLVALGDWVTVKGHTFTAYGVLTGQGKVQSSNPDDVTVLDLAERFEMVFDRSNLLISDDPAERPEVIYKVREPLSAVNPN